MQDWGVGRLEFLEDANPQALADWQACRQPHQNLSGARMRAVGKNITDV